MPADRLAAVGGQLERLSAKVDELVAAVPLAQIGSLDAGQRRAEEVLGQAVAGELVGRVEQLSARVEELAAAVPLDELGSLGEGQRRAEDVLGRVVSELAGLREEAGAKLDQVASVVPEMSRASEQDIEGLAAVLEGVGARIEERVAGRERELVAQVERLSDKVDDLAAAAPADSMAERLADQIYALGEGQHRREETLAQLLTELAELRGSNAVIPRSIDLRNDSSDDLRPKKKEKKGKKKKRKH